PSRHTYLMARTLLILFLLSSVAVSCAREPMSALPVSQVSMVHEDTDSTTLSSTLGVIQSGQGDGHEYPIALVSSMDGIPGKYECGSFSVAPWSVDGRGSIGHVTLEPAHQSLFLV